MSVSMSNCPDCDKQTVRWRYTLRGILYAVLLFPCGIYCCLKKKQQYCPQCKCDVVKYQETPVNGFGYSYHNYPKSHNGLPVTLSSAYRNTALSMTSTAGSYDTTDRCISYTSKTELTTSNNID
uniref:Brain protein I3 n=1 Tax=Heterorhabditis bacteriophora TaxID=37862 RepID=A0A1I7WXD7_HETBA